MTQELIARLEKATGPDRELDCDIALSLGWTLQKMKGDSRAYYRIPGETAYYMRSVPPHYTGSIDAALTLVPEGWWLTLDRYIVSDDPTPNPLTWRAWLRRIVGDVEGDGSVFQQKLIGHGFNPASAVSGAALKARAATSPTQ